MNLARLKQKGMLLLLLLVTNGCTVVKTVTVEKPLYINDLKYNNDTNYSVSYYKLVVDDGIVNVPIDTMNTILNRSNYYKQEAKIKDAVIEAYQDLIKFNNDLIKGHTHEPVEQ